MNAIIRLKLDVTKLDKTAFHHGKKGIYADLTLFLTDEPDQYGQHGRLVQSIPQERRAAGERGAIVGNATLLPPANTASRPAPAARVAADGVPATFDPTDEIPF